MSFELSVHYILLEWVFNIGQVAAIALGTIFVSFLWRKLKPVDRSDGYGRVTSMRHVVIAMNPVMGTSFARHHHLGQNVIVVCSKEEVKQKLEGLDIHEMAVHVAGDTRSITHDTLVFQEILWLTTAH